MTLPPSQSPIAEDLRVGLVDLLGIRMRIIERNGHFELLGVNSDGGATTLVATPGNSRDECVRLMHTSVDMLCHVLDRALVLNGDGDTPRSPQTWDLSEFRSHNHN